MIILGRFIINENKILEDTDTGKTYSDIFELVDLLNQQEVDKMYYKKELSNLRYRIKKLVE